METTVHVVPPPPRSVRAFIGWVADSCDNGSRLLDIGAGANRSAPLAGLARKNPYLVGVDPDEAILHNPALQERYQTSLEDFAVDHPAEFDSAFAVYVLEHVVDPARFVDACWCVLKPGGSLFALTPNVCQYFGATTWALSRIGMSDRLLARLICHDEVHSHHFAPEYRLNSVRTLRRHLANAGFRSVEIRCYDEPEGYEWYLPQSLRWFPPAYSRMAYPGGLPGPDGTPQLPRGEVTPSLVSCPPPGLDPSTAGDLRQLLRAG